MRTILSVAAILGLTLAAPAMAQTNSSPSGTQPAPGAMQASVKHDLEQAGFTDVKVMPSSFLVRAKDKSGHPIMMLINPDSVTEISGMGKPAAAQK